MNRYILLVSLLILSGCSTLSQFKEADQRQSAAQARVVERESESVQASMDATKVHNDELAIKFDEQALSLLGSPKHPIDISKLQTVAQQTTFFKKYAADNQKLVDDNTKLIKEKADLQQKVEEEAKEKEHSDMVSRLWKWGFSLTGALGIGGTIALLVFFPELLPLFMSVAGAVCGVITRIFSAIFQSFQKTT